MTKASVLRSRALTAVNGVLLNRGGSRQATLRRAFFDLASRVSPGIAVEHDGIRYYVSTADKLVGRETFATGPYEVDTMDRALAVLERHGHTLRGRTFVDVGANIGTTTIAALTRFGARDAVAIEPEPGNLRLLRCNLIANDLDDRARVVGVAASAAEGTGTLLRSSCNSGDHRLRLSGANGSAPAEQVVTVPLRRLDDVLCEQQVSIDEIGLVWMDCQGHEAHVLAGAPRLLENSVPLIVEYWPLGLREAGGPDLLHALIAEHYDLVIDVRAGARGAGAPLPARDVHRLEALYPEPSFTDLILLKDGR